MADTAPEPEPKSVGTTAEEIELAPQHSTDMAEPDEARTVVETVDVEAGGGATEAKTDDTGHDEPTGETAPEPKLPFYKRKICKVIAVRVVLRLCMIGLIILLGFLFKPARIVDAYVDWIEDFPSRGSAMTTFVAICSVFSAVAPGSYAPVALAGATFGVLPGWGLGYLILNFGSILNTGFIRMLCRPCCAVRCARRLSRLNVNSLEALFADQPIRTVVLMRLPVIGSGIMNYLFSLSNVLSAKHIFIGNALGWIPGSLMFSFLGTRVRSVGAAILNNEGDTASLVVSILSLVVVMVCMFTVAYMVRKNLRKRGRSRSLQSADGDDGLGIDDIPQPKSTEGDDEQTQQQPPAAPVPPTKDAPTPVEAPTVESASASPVVDVDVQPQDPPEAV